MNEMDHMIPMVIPAEAPASAGEGNKNISFSINKADRIFAVVMFLLAFLAVDTFNILGNHAYYGVGVTVYTLVYGGFVMAYARMSQGKVGKESAFWFAVMTVSALSYTFVYNQSLMSFHALFLRLVTLYFTAVVFGVLITGKTGGFFLLDGLNLLLLIPYANLAAQWKVLQEGNRKALLLRSAVKALLGLIVALPLFAVVIVLLSCADGNFALMLSRFLDQIGESLYRWGGDLLLAIPVGCYLFALTYGAAHRRKTDTVKPENIVKSCSRCAVVPRASIYAVFTGICALYLLFIGLQGSYYLDAVKGVLPEGFTYSGYARRGFFELVFISVINIGIILLSELLCQKKVTESGTKKRAGFLRCCNLVISVLTLFLIGTAMVKMYLYIRVYGLTPLRVIPSLFMGFLAVVFLLIAVAQFKRVPVMRIAVFVFALGYAGLSLGDMDGRIAGYNLNRYQAGTLEEFPNTVLIGGSMASVPAIYRAWTTTQDLQFKKELADVSEAIQENYWYDMEQPDFLGYRSVAKDRAVRQLREMTGQGV